MSHFAERRPSHEAKKRSSSGPNPDHYYEHAPPLPPVVEHLYEHIQDYQKKNSIALMADMKMDFLGSNWQSINLVTSDLGHDSVVTVPPLVLSSTMQENQVGDYVEMRMIVESQDGKCGTSLGSCGTFPGNSSISCGPLAAL